LVTAQRDGSEPASTTLTNESVWQEYYRLAGDIGMLNQRRNSSVRSDWLDSLTMASAPLAEVGDDSSQLKSIHERFVAIRKEVDAHVAKARASWPDVKVRYQAEMDRLASATGVEARARTILRVRYEKTSESVDIAWPFLTTEDVDPIRLMLVNNTHLQDARDADAEEKRAEETADERAKRLGLPQFTSFRLRSIAGGQLSVGVAGLDVSSFQFEEVGPNGRSATLRFAGGGGSVGIEAGATGPGTWTDFDTPKPTRMESFDGVPGSIGGGGAYLVVGAGYTVYTFVLPGGSVVTAKSWGAGFGLGGGVDLTAGTWTVHGL